MTAFLSILFILACIIAAFLIGIFLFNVLNPSEEDMTILIPCFIIVFVMILFSLNMPVNSVTTVIPHALVRINDKEWISYENQLAPFQEGDIIVLKENTKYINGYEKSNL